MPLPLEKKSINKINHQLLMLFCRALIIRLRNEQSCKTYIDLQLARSAFHATARYNKDVTHLYF